MLCHNPKELQHKKPFVKEDQLSYQQRDALHACMQISQQEVYAQEINDLCKLSQVSSNSQLQLLHLFLDKEDYL